MKTFTTILNVLGLIAGMLFLIAGGSDIQIGFGMVLLLVAYNGLRPNSLR